MMNVDKIWEELKAQTTLRHTGIIDVERLMRNKCRKKKEKSAVNSLKITGRNCYKVWTSNPAGEKENDNSLRRSHEVYTDFEWGELERDNSKAPYLYDSDDDDNEPDHEIMKNEVDSPDRNVGNELGTTRLWNIGRIASAMQSCNVIDRTKALEILHQLVRDIEAQLPLVQEMNFPPPFNVDRISLTHRSTAMVSDLASYSYQSQWSHQWQKTHTSLSECMKNENQFKQDLLAEDSFESLESKKLREKLQTLLDKCGSVIFRRFNDESERCRELSLGCSIVIALHAVDFGKHIPFLMSALLSRFPTAVYDEDLQIFVHDMKRHEEYKRGIAVERQDKESLLNGVECLQVVEKSEELRLLLCGMISSVIRGAIGRGCMSILNPYFVDIILALHSLLRDPFPLVKIEASSILVQLMRIPQWEMCSKRFSTGLARAAIPNLRHRNSNVRLASLDLFEASVCVPDREKLRGAGSEAITDLVGFREENVRAETIQSCLSTR